jgi:Type I restriction-modification system methyltransferase subunit
LDEAAEVTIKEHVFNNSNLFSNHYLENMVQKSSEWDDESGLLEAYTRIKDKFFEKEKNFPRYVEADLEHNWIRPVLDALGHHYGVQESLHHDPLKPDYAFFPDAEALNEAYSQKGSDDFYKRSVAVGDAKAWNVVLDKSRQGRVLREMTNPSFQIDNYLRATPPKWAILTNGRLWRLYHEDSSVSMDSYYEVNLPDLIAQIEETGDLSIFKYFYLFFRREAFPETPLGPSFLDKIREESLAYAQKVGEDLQENVYRAMKVLAEGFIYEPANSLWPLTVPQDQEQMLREVQENSLRLLYRLLFIFYAESRRLLKVDNRHYREMSLRRLKEEIAGKKDRGEKILAIQSTYWESLRDLFRLINDGSEAFGYSKEEFYIPAYNGGLFDPTKNPFLREKRIGNSYLAEAIDLLARSQGESGPVFVDYSSLDIRHLGSIYEGILEYRLNIATESMVAVKEKSKKGKEVWLPKREAGGKKVSDSVEAGGLYLVTDKGERKATGSFYTPQYIVKYIVKNTLEPLIKPMMEEASMDADLRTDLLRKLLSIKVLDPAMGSGHFLVEATDYIAREIIHAREIARQEDEDSDAIAENDIHWARREVVRNCIYGVDLNPMAVELAKLSLWLKTVASNKPLSFLDHHLRCGNSLIGADLEKLSVLPGTKAQEPPLWSFGLKSHTDSLLRKYSLMSALPDDSLQMVKWKEEQFRQIKESELSRRLAELANVWLSTFFGNKVKEDDYYELQGHLSPEKFPDWAGLREKEWFGRAQEIAGEKRFFHWELEFPEAFSGEGRGFDVVIGNPPYVRVQELSHEDTDYFKSLFCTAYKRVDISILFFEVALKSISENGIAAYISSTQFLTSEYGRQLRKLLLKNRILSLLDFKDLPVFEEATTYAGIIIFSSGEPQPFNYYEIENLPSNKHCQLVTGNGFKIDSAILNDNSWQLVDNRLKMILNKIGDNLISGKLSSIADTKGGVITGKDDIFNLDQSKIEEWKIERELLLPLVRGPDVSRYYAAPSMFLLYPYEQIQNGDSKLLSEKKLRDSFPYAYAYLRSHEEELRDRKDSRKSVGSSNDWYKLIRYGSNRLFQSKKILTPGESMRNSFAVDCTGSAFSFARVYAVVAEKVKTDFLAAILNSKVLEFFLHSICPIKRGGYFTFSSTYLAEIPIRRISFTTPAPERARLVAELQQLYDEGKDDEILAGVEALLPKDEAGNFITEEEKSDVVHDLLAFLAERMLEMNKVKQKEIRGFLDWLEGYLGAKIEDLKPKTRILSYYESDYESLLAVLKKNKKKLAVDPSRREPGELLRAEFDESMNKLGPLREKIKRTDELIDAVVYRLYGLTDEEIGIVKGNSA